MNVARKDDGKDPKLSLRGRTAIESEIAHELARLSRTEQIRTTQDVEGKNMLAAAEPRKLVELGLNALDKRLQDQLRSTEDTTLAASLQSPMAKERPLRLKMLRAENFDSELAAKRMINYLALLREVLAESATTDDDGSLRPIKLARDFASADRERQSLGALQLLLFRDQAGRRVAGCFDVDESPSSGATNIKASLLKEALFLFQAASEDETTQKEGLVFIFMVLNASSTIVGSDLVPILGRLFQCGPLRVAAVHTCSPDSPELHNMTAALVRRLDSRDRVKARFHYGTSWEYTKSLKRFGVPTDWLPTTQANGTVRNNYHKQWIAIREAKERPNFEGIECPDSHDILLGRGQVLQFHQGNISLREDFIKERYPQFSAATSKQQKDVVLNQILHDLAKKKRRFLKQKQDNTGLWFEIGKSEARSKLVTSFREQKRAVERKPAASPT